MSRAILPGALAVFLLLQAERQEAAGAKKITVIALVRHAEKAGDSGDPGLTAAGRKRAEALERTFRGARVHALVSSALRRTKETLEPLAKAKGLTVESAAEAEDVVRVLKKLAPGSLAVVAHHSYTLRAILDGLGVPAGDAAAVDVGLDVHDQLLLVAIHPGLETRLVPLKY